MCIFFSLCSVQFVDLRYVQFVKLWFVQFAGTLPFTVPVFMLSMVLKHIPGALHDGLHH